MATNPPAEGEYDIATFFSPAKRVKRKRTQSGLRRRKRHKRKKR
jgi:hypothetical protein